MKKYRLEGLLLEDIGLLQMLAYEYREGLRRQGFGPFGKEPLYLSENGRATLDYLINKLNTKLLKSRKPSG